MSEANKAQQQKPVVTFLGPVASYTHQAALETFASSSHTLTPVTTIEDVFASVQSGTATRGVVPFENSSNGSVVFTLDLFADTHNKYPDIQVCGEAYIAVQHCLLGRADPDTHPNPSPPRHGNPQHAVSLPSRTTEHRSVTGAGVIESPLSSGAVTPTSSHPNPPKPTARPVADLSKITKLYSHPQAWGQCKVFLNTYLKGVERRDVSSTSRAAQLVAEDASGESAAVSSITAAGVHGLGVLAKGIEDRGDNMTRFFVIRKGDKQPAGTIVSGLNEEAEAGKGDREGKGKGEWKTLVSFTVDHANPGSLAHSLAVFERYGLNLTSINTRPSGVENWNYIFFVEVRGRREEESDDGPVNKALRDLDTICRAWRWLGSWENRLAR